jgi:hypothetical protein
MFPIAASIPYLFYFFFLLILTCYKKIKSRNQILFLLLLIAIVVFISYNGEYSDWRAYKAYTDNCRCIECTYFEPLFDLLTYVASQTIGFKLIPLVSFIMLFIVFIKINKFANNNLQYFILTLSIFLIFLPLYYGALRQSISFSFVLLSLLYFYDAKYFKSIFLVILAMGFHLSAIIIYLVFLIYLLIWKITYQNLKYFIIFLIISFLAGIVLMNIFYSDMAIIDSFNAGTRNAKVDRLKIMLLPIERTVILVMSIYIMNFFKHDKTFVYMALISISGALFYLVVYKYSLNTAGRITAFFRLADLFILYYFFKILFSRNKLNINTNHLNNISIVLIVLYSIIKYYFTIVSVGFFR